ncbi:MAG TPA: tetratricopeptide repeat protein [Ramlibacter sp.]|nr:tetratricopeptide repeat protein [Ramlibacter sp.]
MANPKHLARIAAVCSLTALFAMPPCAFADDYTDVNRLVQARQFDVAMARAEQYLAAKPRDPQMRFLKGVIEAETGKRKQAIDTYTQLTQEYPELPEPYNNLAVLYAQGNEYDKAREALEGAVRANPGYAIAHENLGDVYAKLASQSYAKAQQIDPANPTAPAKLSLVRQLLSSTQAKSR